MNFFSYDMKIPLGCAAVAFHFFIAKTIVSKYHGICGEPAFIIIYIEFIIRFVNDQVDSTHREVFPRSPLQFSFWILSETCSRRTQCL